MTTAQTFERIELSVASWGARQQFGGETTIENVTFVCTVRYSRCGQPINDCPRYAGVRWSEGFDVEMCRDTDKVVTYTPGGRSRRGSPKAGTAVGEWFSRNTTIIHWHCADQWRSQMEGGARGLCPPNLWRMLLKCSPINWRCYARLVCKWSLGGATFVVP